MESVYYSSVGVLSTKLNWGNLVMSPPPNTLWTLPSSSWYCFSWSPVMSGSFPPAGTHTHRPNIQSCSHDHNRVCTNSALIANAAYIRASKTYTNALHTLSECKWFTCINLDHFTHIRHTHLPLITKIRHFCLRQITLISAHPSSLFCTPSVSPEIAAELDPGTKQTWLKPLPTALLQQTGV